MKLGIVGHGFVGTAVDHGFTRDIQKFIVDPKHNSTNTIEDLIKFKPDATFVAVPTPQSGIGRVQHRNTGRCDATVEQQQRFACDSQVNSASIQITDNTGSSVWTSG